MIVYDNETHKADRNSRDLLRSSFFFKRVNNLSKMVASTAVVKMVFTAMARFVLWVSLGCSIEIKFMRHFF